MRVPIPKYRRRSCPDCSGLNKSGMDPTITPGDIILCGLCGLCGAATVFDGNIGLRLLKKIEIKKYPKMIRDMIRRGQDDIRQHLTTRGGQTLAG